MLYWLLAPGLFHHVVFAVCLLSVHSNSIEIHLVQSRATGGTAVNRKASLSFLSICSVFTNRRPQVVFAPFRASWGSSQRSDNTQLTHIIRSLALHLSNAKPGCFDTRLISATRKSGIKSRVI